jgi:galactokinase
LSASSVSRSFSVLSPGRVNLLGEHVDYNDGPVLPAAIDRAVRLSIQPDEGSIVHIRALDLNEETAFDLNSLEEKKDISGQDMPGWARYAAGVAWVLQEQGFSVKGMRAEFTSNIPIGSGLSSSAAVEVGFAVAWRVLGGWDLDAMQIALLCQKAENRYVGVNCGLMDQFACANGVEGHALYFDTRSLNWHPVPLPAGVAIIIADSGVRRSLANSAYNERRSACEQAVALLRPALPGIRALRDVTPEQFAENAGLLPETIRKRAHHIVMECDRVDQAIYLLEAGDAPGFGRLMFAGHASLRDLYEVSCPELDCLVEIAASLPGCLGARLTGAGFGGCTVNLVRDAAAPDFIENLKAGYLAKMGQTAQVYLCHASQGTHVVD